MVAEYNTTLSDVTCTGAGLLKVNPYKLTHTLALGTTHTYKQWGFDSSIDDGSGGLKTINCQAKGGSTAVGAGSEFRVTFYAADYYVTESGNILLDTEQSADSSTTRTSPNLVVVRGFWAA
jgi:hypothetical protein